MEKPIIFDIDIDNKPIKDTITKDNIKELMFGDQYILALQQIDQYLATLSINSVEDDNNSRVFEYDDSFDIDCNNNIFAFIGERGTGKTSCMISVGDLLCSKRKDAFTEYVNISKYNFKTIDLIDPSYFDSSHNVISLFLAKLYDSYKRYVDKNNRSWDINEEKRTEFLEELAKAQKHLMQLDPTHKEESNMENSIELLVDLSSAVDLKADIRKLIDSYNSVLGFKNSILVLRIDDIDLNTENSAKMAEYIRKYLIQPNMIVLISLKLEQLEAIKRNEFMKTYDMVSKDVNTADMAVKYINKFIPQSQRIHMPVPQNYLERTLTIKSKKFPNDLSYTSIKLAVPELIFQKTRYLFYNSKIQRSRIIPRNLRELRQVIKLLCLMPDYSKESPSITNKDIFKNYFFSSWIEQNIDKEDQHFLRELFNEEDILHFNSHIIHVLNKKFKIDELSPYTSEMFAESMWSEISDIISSQNLTYNISTGDVLGLIDALESKYQSPQDVNFLFFIKSLYSMRLYEAYDAVTEIIANDLDEEKQIYRLPLLDNLSPYSKICGGSLFNNILTPLIPDIEAVRSYVSQDFDGRKLLGVMQECLKDWNAALKDGSVKIVEFFMLSIVGNHSDDHRGSADVYYNNRSLSQQLEFNLYSVFYNLTQLCNYKKEKEEKPNEIGKILSWPCYNRFSNYLDNTTRYRGVANKFLHLLMQHHDFSYKLWPHLMFDTLREKQGLVTINSLENYDVDELVKDFKPERWMSYCCFRNSEILQDFAQYMNENSYYNASPAIIFYKFFDKVSKYSIKTYDMDANGYPYKISFGYANSIKDIFKKNPLNSIDRVINEVLSPTAVSDSSVSKDDADFGSFTNRIHST